MYAIVMKVTSPPRTSRLMVDLRNEISKNESKRSLNELPDPRLTGLCCAQSVAAVGWPSWAAAAAVLSDVVVMIDSNSRGVLRFPHPIAREGSRARPWCIVVEKSASRSLLVEHPKTLVAQREQSRLGGVRLLLIRHGQTPGNVLGQLDTAHPGPGLTDLGHQQARDLTTTLQNENIETLHSSTLIRTQLTAGPLSEARKLDIDVRTGLHEIEAGSLELRSDRDSIRQYLETIYAWGLGDLDTAMPGGPDGHAFFGRFDDEIAAISAAGSNVAAVVSHGAAIRVWVSARANNIVPSFGAENNLDNTGIVVLDGSARDGWTLVNWAGATIDPLH